jgi:hypothetical protein
MLRPASSRRAHGGKAIDQPADCDNRENGMDHLGGYLWLVVLKSVRSSTTLPMLTSRTR